MDFKIGSIDGMSFEKSESHQVKSMKGSYNNLRSHGFVIAQLASKLGCTRLLSSTDSGCSGSILHPGDDLNYTLNALPNLEFGECKHTDKAKYGILVQLLVTDLTLPRLEKFIDSVDHLFIYSSDYDYELRNHTFNAPFLLEFMRLPGDEEIKNKLREKLRMSFCGWNHISKISESSRLSNIKSVFLPQVINPFIPKNPVSYSQRPYDGFLMGMDKASLEFIKMDPNKNYLSIQYRSENVPHTEFRNITQILQSGICLDLNTLLATTSLCKFHPLTNSWKNIYPSLVQNSDMLFNQTFKLFEAYYGGMYPIAPCQTFESIHFIMDSLNSEEVYIRSVEEFRSSFEKFYSYSRYEPILDSLVKELID